MDDDWIRYVFEKCKIVSDSEMQSLWSRLLAEESNRPNSFSRKTIDIVSTLDKSDAHSFTQFCTYSISIKGKKYSFIAQPNEKFYVEKGMNRMDSNPDNHFNFINHLIYLGLISFKQDKFQERLPVNTEITYFDTCLNFKPRNMESNFFTIASITSFTKAGEELAHICGAKSDPEFLDYLIKHFESKGLEVEIKI